MLRYLILVIASALFCFGCTKSDKYERRILGSWNVVTFKHKSNEGITTYEPVKGMLEFHSAGVYNINLEKTNTQVIDGGKFQIDQTEHTYIQLNGNTSFYGLNEEKEARILTLTRTDLELEFSTNNGTMLCLILRKTAH